MIYNKTEYVLQYQSYDGPWNDYKAFQSLDQALDGHSCLLETHQCLCTRILKRITIEDVIVESNE